MSFFRGHGFDPPEAAVIVAACLLVFYKSVSYHLGYKTKLFPTSVSEKRIDIYAFVLGLIAYVLAVVLYFTFSRRHTWAFPICVLAAVGLFRWLANWLSRAIFGEDYE